MSNPPQSHMLFEFGSFRVDLAKRVLTKGQQIVLLTAKAFDTLVVLLRNSGHIMEKDELLKEVWPAGHVCRGGRSGSQCCGNCGNSQDGRRR